MGGTVIVSRWPAAVAGESECLFRGGSDEWLPETQALMWQQKWDSVPSSDFPP